MSNKHTSLLSSEMFFKSYLQGSCVLLSTTLEKCVWLCVCKRVHKIHLFQMCHNPSTTASFSTVFLSARFFLSLIFCRFFLPSSVEPDTFIKRSKLESCDNELSPIDICLIRVFMDFSSSLKMNKHKSCDC